MDPTALTAKIVSAYVRQHQVATSNLPSLIGIVSRALVNVGKPFPQVSVAPTPAAPIRRSVSRESIVCLECGQSLKMLRRHLQRNHDLSTKAYRERWGLPDDYPMTAPNYAERRSQMAVKHGLGRRPATAK